MTKGNVLAYIVFSLDKKNCAQLRLPEGGIKLVRNLSGFGCLLRGRRNKHKAAFGGLGEFGRFGGFSASDTSDF
jgi:hypothetical protein